MVLAFILTFDSRALTGDANSPDGEWELDEGFEICVGRRFYGVRHELKTDQMSNNAM